MIKALAFFLVIPCIISAQGNRKQTIILNDGSWITGTVVSDSGDYLRILVRKPQVVSIPASEVFTWNTALKAKPLHKPRLPYESKDEIGYNIRLSISVLAGKNEQGSTGTLSFHFMTGYRFASRFTAGIGAGIEDFETLVMPVYADLRYHPLGKRVTPFVWLKSGIGIPVGRPDDQVYYDYGQRTDPRAGAMINSGIGIEINSGRFTGVNIGLGYRYQKLSFRQANLWSTTSTDDIITYFRRVEVQFGFIFH